MEGLDHVSGEGCAGVVHIALPETRRGMKSGEGSLLNILHYKVHNHYEHRGSHRSTMYYPLNDRKVAFRHRVNRPTMSFTDRSILPGIDGSSSSLRRATWTARYVGMQVNRDTTSNDTKISFFVNACVAINSAKAFEFFT